jgi:hypothetical protein
MDRAKYIVLDRHNAIIFPSGMNHSDVARAFGKERVTSAGFVQFLYHPASDDVHAHAYGESETLGLKPGEKDDYCLTQLCRDM